MTEEASETKIQDYSTELESGIFNLVISLVSHKTIFAPQDLARESVARYLESLVNALREQD